MMEKSKEERIKGMLDKIASVNNTIDLNAYAIGLSDMYDRHTAPLLSRIEELEKEVRQLEKKISNERNKIDNQTHNFDYD